MKRIGIALVVLAGLIAVVGVVWASSHEEYDTNDNDRIDHAEIRRAVEDYLKGDLSQEDAVDLWFRWIANDNGWDRPQWTLPEAGPTPTATPEVVWTPTPISKCPAWDGWVKGLDHRRTTYDNDRPVRPLDMQTTFINPSGSGWTYGYRTTWGEWGFIELLVTSEGKWQIWTEPDGILHEGLISDISGAYFNSGPGEKNTLRYVAWEKDRPSVYEGYFLGFNGDSGIAMSIGSLDQADYDHWPHRHYLSATSHERIFFEGHVGCPQVPAR